ncbi:hypothetical protein C1Y40_05860 [Mycobacterium talmoniae]|uniref:Uncharacterized protein n=1 Tax=Mycobacterium talmoniae TaxID=1858794 RepID=A0A2S8BBF3_9MYCO|nr:hypothetical protein C1Y40_05860 [Mycobacterium talmoniae]
MMMLMRMSFAGRIDFGSSSTSAASDANGDELMLLSRFVSDETGSEAAAGAARLCSALGVVDVNWDSTDWVLDAAEDPTACATAAP